MRSPLVLSVCALSVHVVLGVNPLVELPYSTYLGTAQSSGITSWLGIRFAAPPLGDLRFRAPRAPVVEYVVQNANEHGPICLSTPGGPPDNTTSEDCLFLDVYAPSNATKASKLPVYFFIQGGGFNIDSNANYRGDGLILASDMNIVVVNFNYRVGLYGFLASEELVNNGHTNAGLLDQRKAMEWVQKHISKFGGDPSHVTLGGDSAGGASIALHLTAYGGRDDGLFHAAAAESATFGNMLTVSESQYQYDALVQRIGCASAADSLSCLRQTNVTYLQANNYPIPFPGSGATASAPIYMYGPTIDGDLIQNYTYSLFSEGNFIRVPAIFGDDTNGGTIFTPQNTSDYADMDHFLRDQFPAFASDQLLAMNAMYPEAEQFNGTGAYWRTVSNAYGEMRYMCPGLAVSAAINTYGGSGSWNYRYNVEDPTEMANGFGVPHTFELAAIWGPEYFAGTAAASYYTTNAAIIPVVQAYWTSFIRSYNPNTYRAAGSPEWEQFTGASQDRLMLMTNATSMETVAQDLQARCAYLTSNGIALQQ